MIDVQIQPHREVRNMSDLGKIFLNEIEIIGQQGGSIGEISLSEHTTLKLSGMLAERTSEFPYYNSGQTAVAATVAVNLAYYYYGREGDHFLSHMFHGNYSPDMLTPIGQKIEDLLIEKKIIAFRREGPWKYVGLIVRQAIVTRRYFRRLAQFLEVCDRTLGINKLNRISFEGYKALLKTMSRSQGFGHTNWMKANGIFFDILRDHQGFNLVKTVGELYDQFLANRKSTEDLDSLPGFRKGFWVEFLPYMFKSKKAPAKTTFRQPVFRYNCSFNRVGIQFDSEGVERGFYTIISASGDEKVTRAFLPCSSAESLQDEFQLRFNDGSTVLECNITGWMPDDRSVFQALFRERDGVMVASVNNPATLLDGDYYLITKAEIHESELREIHRHYYNELDIEGVECFKIWKIHLRQGIKIPGLGDVLIKQPAGLEWVHPDYFPGTDPEGGVFVGRLPRLRVRGWQLLRNRFILVQTVHGYTSTIPETSLEVEGDEAFLELEIKPLNQGFVRLEKAGLSSIQPACSEKKFFVLPSLCAIRWSSGLLGTEETPYVAFRPNSIFDMEWRDSVNEKSNNGEISWNFQPRTPYALGKSKVYPDINFEIRFFVAEFYPVAPPPPSTRYIVWSSTLDHDTEFLVSGYPNSPVELALLDDTGYTHRLYKVQWPGLVKARINGLYLKERISPQTFVVGRFVLKWESRWKETGCSFVSETGIIHAVCNNNFDDTAFPVQAIGIEFSAAMAAIHEVKPYIFASSMQVPGKVASFLVFVEAGGLLFDRNQPVNMESDRYKDSDFQEWLKWYSEFLSASDLYAITQSTPDTNPDLPVERWNEKIYTALSSLRSISNIEDFIGVWEKLLADYSANGQFSIRGIPPAIQGLEGLENSIRAAFYFRNKRWKDAQRVSSRNVDKHPRPVSTLNRIISYLSMLRQGSKEIILGKEESGNDEWLNLFNVFVMFTDIFRGIFQDFTATKPENLNALKHILDALEETSLTLLVDVAKRETCLIPVDISPDADWLLMYALFKNESVRAATGIDRGAALEIVRKQLELGLIPRCGIALEITNEIEGGLTNDI